MEASARARFDREGCIVVKGALSSQRLAQLNAVYDREIEKRLAAAQRAAPFDATPMTHDCKYSPLDPAAVTNDGHRFRLESINHDLPGGSSFWDQCFVDLVDMPGVIGIVEELVADEERWHHLGARLPPAGAPASVRLSHHNMFFRPPWGADAPADRGGSLHGGGNRGEGCTISVAYELLDVGPHDGGFGWIPGSHRPEFELPSHASWRTAWATEKLRGPNWPAHCAVNRTPAAAGDAIIFTEHLTHGTLPWDADTERRTLFFKYGQYGRAPGNCCAFYDTKDARLTPAQAAILDGGAWGGYMAGLATHTARLRELDAARQAHAAATTDVAEAAPAEATVPSTRGSKAAL